MAGFHFGRQERLQSESRGLISGFWEIRYERLCNSGRECWVVYMCKSRCSVEGAVPTLQLRMSACTCIVWCTHGTGWAMVPRSNEWGIESSVGLRGTTGLIFRQWSISILLWQSHISPRGWGCFLIMEAAPEATAQTGRAGETPDHLCPENTATWAHLSVTGAVLLIPGDTNLLLAC